MSPIHRMHPLKYRSIFISDVHLGSKDCKAEFLLDFLKSTESEYLYLVGDIVDLWAMSRSLYWPQAHNNVIRTILGKAKHGTKVIYVPGNHDDPLRDYSGMIFGNVAVHREHIHTTADGRRLLLMHGDEFDAAVKCGRLAHWIGDRGYDFLLQLNRVVNHLRRRLGLPYWSLATYMKRRIKGAARHIRNFEEAVAHEVHRRGVDGLVCGHIHHAEMDNINGALYCNDGDWVENCTALVEEHGGQLHLVHWADAQVTVKSMPQTTPVPASKVA